MRSWYLADIEKQAKGFKYTFFVPPKSVIKRLDKGNEVRLRFAIRTPEPEGPEAERMWVEITEKTEEGYSGLLTNNPEYIDDLKLGDRIEFEAKHIMDSDLKSEEEDLVEKYIHLCFVSNQIWLDGKKVGYLHRQESKGEWNDGVFDSGWILQSGEEDEEYVQDSKNLRLLSLGAILNRDDSFIALLDSPVGSAYLWDEKKGEYVNLE